MDSIFIHDILDFMDETQKELETLRDRLKRLEEALA